MEGNASITGNTGGGGVLVEGGTFALQSGTITGNTASSTSQSSSASGGGVYIRSGTFTMEGGTISNNTVTASSTSLVAYAKGGGVFVEQGTFALQSGTITGNTASSTSGDNYGGGVYVEKGTFTMQGGTISNNTSSHSGGGVYVGENGTFTIQEGTISDNTATASSTSGDAYAVGGGVFVSNDGTFTMLNGTISGNTATASARGFYISSNSRSRAYSYGGGVYVGGNRSGFTMQGGTITGNSSSSTTTSSLYSNSYGGGVYVQSVDRDAQRLGEGKVSAFTMQGNASITGNRTVGSGGGVYVSCLYSSGLTGTFTMQGNASVSGNTAGISGGGVYVGENGTFAMQGDASVSGNTANYYGGGVSVEGGTLTKTGGTVYGEDADTNQKNSVVSRIGNAVYESKDGGWRNVTAGPTMNPGSYGFWLNDGDVVTFPSGFAGTYQRSNFDNRLTVTSNIIKASNSDRMWVLQRISGNAYTLKRADTANTITLTISLTGRNLVITGDSGSGQDNWNGTWNRQ
jgi:hypothetical protein